MPNFPNINTLIPKQNITGDEVIQISATERATLNQIVSKLSLGTLLEGYTPEELNVVDNVLSSSDTIFQAFKKLEARVGSNRHVILPLEGLVTPDSPTIQGVITVGMKADHFVELTTIYQPKEDNSTNWTVKKLTLSYDTPLSSSYGTLDGLWNYIISDPSTRTFYITTNDRLVSVTGRSGSGAEVILKPGDVLTGSNFSSIKFDTSWLSTQSQYHAAIVTSDNITKSLFDRSTPAASVTMYFSPDFDDNPGTPLQAVCIQLISKIDSRSQAISPVFIINKCGYDDD